MIVTIQTHFWPFSSEQKLWKSSYGIIKNRRGKTIQKIERVRYYELFDHTFSDQNYSKVCKFCTYTTSHSFFDYFLLIFQISTFQWLNFTNLKYELNRSYIGGGVVYVLKARHLDQHGTIKMCTLSFADGSHCSFNLYTKESFLKNVFIYTK